MSDLLLRLRALKLALGLPTAHARTPAEVLSDATTFLTFLSGGPAPTSVGFDPAAPGGDFTAFVNSGDFTAQKPEHAFVDDVLAELRRARKKFPNSTASMTALTEEVGELARAMLGESQQRIYQEAVQVAGMAARVALDGDPTLIVYRHGIRLPPFEVEAKGRRPKDGDSDAEG